MAKAFDGFWHVGYADGVGVVFRAQVLNRLFDVLHVFTDQGLFCPALLGATEYIECGSTQTFQLG